MILLELFVIVNTKLSPDKHRERNKVRTKPKQSLKYKDCGEYHSVTLGFTLRLKDVMVIKDNDSNLRCHMKKTL